MWELFQEARCNASMRFRKLPIRFQLANVRLTSFFSILAGRRIRDSWRRSHGFAVTTEGRPRS